jgi:hypothetical protein
MKQFVLCFLLKHSCPPEDHTTDSSSSFDGKIYHKALVGFAANFLAGLDNTTYCPSSSL